MFLQRAAGMKPALRFNVGIMRGLLGRERAEVNGLVFHADVSNPYAVLCGPRGSEKATCIERARNAHIFVVRGLRDITQIGRTVISAIAIDMVNVMRWPLAVHVKPCESMSEMVSTVYVDLDVAVAMPGTGNASDTNSVGRSRFPAKNAGFRLVFENFAKSFDAKIGLNHDALSVLIGQRRADARNIRPASRFYTQLGHVPCF